MATTNAELLTQAIDYASGHVARIEPAFLGNPTPCDAWNLASLLEHLNESMTVFHDGIATGRVDLVPVARSADEPARDLVAAFHAGAAKLLSLSAPERRSRAVRIADRSMSCELLTAVGAVELAVHGWDVGQACGWRQPIPEALAGNLLGILPLIVTARTRGIDFAEPVTVSASAPAGDRLVGLLGRDPDNAVRHATRLN